MITVGIAGTGAIGMQVLSALDQNEISGMSLAAFSARNETRSAEISQGLQHPVPAVCLEQLPNEADIVVECLPPNLFKTLAWATVEAGKTLIAMSASQLIGTADLISRAGETGAKIIVPSGAILGLDAIYSAAQSKIFSVTIVTTKPPDSLAKAPYVVDKKLDLSKITKATMLISGSVSDVAPHFPANVNVAAAVSLAGIGPDRTQMEIWVDPTISRNNHTVTVTSDSSDCSMSIEGRPSPSNPATGLLPALSVIACLRRLTAPLLVGT